MQRAEENALPVLLMVIVASLHSYEKFCNKILYEKICRLPIKANIRNNWHLWKRKQSIFNVAFFQSTKFFFALTFDLKPSSLRCSIRSSYMLWTPFASKSNIRNEKWLWILTDVGITEKVERTKNWIFHSKWGINLNYNIFLVHLEWCYGVIRMIYGLGKTYRCFTQLYDFILSFFSIWNMYFPLRAQKWVNKMDRGVIYDKKVVSHTTIWSKKFISPSP